MFKLSDKTRRRISLAAFVVFGVVPAAIVLVCGIARHTPGHVRSVAERLSWQLGQKVSLERIRYLTPGVVVYEGLELSDPETGARILRCRTLKAGRETAQGAGGERRPCLTLIASQAEFSADRLDALWQLARGVLAGRIGSPAVDVRLAAGDVRLLEGETCHALTGLKGRIDRLAGGSQADVAFRLADVETPEPIQLRMARNAQADPPASGMGIYTGGGSLPCRLLAVVQPEFGALGPESRFAGYVWANEAPDGWGGELAGRFSGVDLEGLVARHLPHTLRSTAQLNVPKAVFRGGRLEEAEGSLVAGPGAISRSLLVAAVERLRMVPGAEPGELDPLVAYDRLALSFRIDPHGLQLQGACPPAGCGTVLAKDSRMVLAEPRSQPVPVAALIQTFAPPGAVQVPATRQTDWLMRRLPVPEAFPLHTAAAPSPAAR